MNRRINIMGFSLFFILGIFSLSFSAEDEDMDTFTITTYYPSPYGSYNEMRVKKMIVGELDSTKTPAPSDGAVTFMPTTQPSSYSKGTLYYDNNEKTFKYYDGKDWKKFGFGYTEACIGGLCCALGTECTKGASSCVPTYTLDSEGYPDWHSCRVSRVTTRVDTATAYCVEYICEKTEFGDHCYGNIRSCNLQ